MNRIYKYPVLTSIRMPKSAQILTVQNQRGEPCLWALCNPDEETETRFFRVYGTGDGVNPAHRYISTWQSGPFIWHLFETTRMS
jgi:hypothetical protein